jgi:hypothetical protein
MSKIEVDKIDPQSGTDLELGTSGDTITIPAGVTFDSSAATNTLPSNVVTTDGTQTLTNKSIAATQLTGTVATSNLGTGTADATTFLRGDQTYASATPAADSITTSQLAYNPNPFRNIIINGDMSISQRGTSFTGLGDTNSQYTLDRFKWVEEGATDTAEYTVSQSTDVPTGQGFSKSLKIDCTTADTSVDANNIQYIGTAIEGQNLQYLKYGTSNAESTTLSFWVRSNKTGTYGVALISNDSTEYLYSQTYTINSADTWEKKTLTFVGDTSANFDNDNGNSLLIQWYLVAGTNKSSGSSQTWGSYTQANRAAGQTVNLADSTSNEWYITGVQLEAGTSASDFEFLPVDVNLARCQRYFELLIGSRSQYSRYSSVTYVNPFFFKVTKRANPTISKDEANFTLFYNNGFDTGVTWNSDIMSVDQVTIYMSSTRDYGFIGPDESKPFKVDSEL